ncbi:MAG: hypothetical protein IKX67_06975, partial [Bacteroidales bacterium]|nr:hypothetical protein [Bacteroidales bacterium]
EQNGTILSRRTGKLPFREQKEPILSRMIEKLLFQEQNRPFFSRRMGLGGGKREKPAVRSQNNSRLHLDGRREESPLRVVAPRSGAP